MKALRHRLAVRITRPFLWMFEALAERLAALDARVAALGARVASIDERVTSLDEHVASLDARVASLDEHVAPLDVRLAAVESRIVELQTPVERSHALLRAVAAEESSARRHLWRARSDPDYARAFEEHEPLVTVSVITRDRVALLTERSLPSILAQTYERLEVLVVGDDATPEVSAAVRAVRDDRVRFVNLTTRVVREPADRHWLTASTLPRNEAYRLAGGRWLLDFDDDDALLPDAVESLLEVARAERAEVAYGAFRIHDPDGRTRILGEFPPRFGHFSLASALVHAGLRFFHRELHAADLGLPGDWYRTERMLRTGVRFAWVQKTMFDYYPSMTWDPDQPFG